MNKSHDKKEQLKKRIKEKFANHKLTKEEVNGLKEAGNEDLIQYSRMLLDKDKINEVALKMFFSMTDKWQLYNQQKMKLLGLENTATFFNYKKYKKGKLSKDKLERISHIISIYKSLQILLPNTANDWINKENTLFNGLKPLDIMLSDNVSDLYIIRKYLNAERGALYD